MVKKKVDFRLKDETLEQIEFLKHNLKRKASGAEVIEAAIEDYFNQVKAIEGRMFIVPSRQHPGLMDVYEGARMIATICEEALATQFKPDEIEKMKSSLGYKGGMTEGGIATILMASRDSGLDVLIYPSWMTQVEENEE